MADNETLNKLNENLEKAREELQSISDKTLRAARGAWNRVEQTSTELFDDLVKAGEKVEKERSKAQKKAQKGAGSEGLRGKLAELMGMPTRDEVEALNRKLNTLSRKVRKIEKESTSA